jgi:UDP-3-O-[3-hydroxymyristoyl] glucosamine N-acyltransferase
MSNHVNDASRPLIFLGTNLAMLKLVEVCEDFAIPIAGIIDDNYFGNTETYCELPIIDTEQSFNDAEKLEHYRNNYNFFCAVNWTPEIMSYAVRNREKRQQFINLIKTHNLNCISLVDRTARVSRRSHVGRNVYLDAHVMVEPSCQIGNFTSAYYNTAIGHNNTIGENCVFQRQCIVMGNNVVGDNVYFGPTVRAMKYGATFSSGTFIHEGIYLRRGTVTDEVVSLTSPNQSRVVHQHIIE